MKCIYEIKKNRSSNWDRLRMVLCIMFKKGAFFNLVKNLWSMLFIVIEMSFNAQVIKNAL